MRVTVNLLESLLYISVIKFPSIFSRVITIPLRKMDNTVSKEVARLVQRLNEAERRSKILNLEVKDIRKQLATLTESTGSLNASILSETNFMQCIPSSSTTPPTTKRLNDGNIDSHENKRLKIDFQRENDYVIVYTDGACENNGRANAKAGVGVWFGENHPLNVSEPVNGKATNNTAEIQACVQALNVARNFGISKIKIMTDSEFTINCMTKWIKKWKKNNWKLASGGNVKNKTDLEKLDTICGVLSVKWEHVRGHQGIKGNEEADKLAREGALKYRSS